MQLDNQITHHVPVLEQRQATGRALVPFANTIDMVRIENPTNQSNSPEDTSHSLASDAAKLVNVRNVSPVEMVEISLDLYAMGLLSFDDYSALAYHSEIHPEYDRTIGALTGEPADPNRKRDFISEWENKHRFLRRNSPDNKRLVEQSARITELFRFLEYRTSVIA